MRRLSNGLLALALLALATLDSRPAQADWWYTYEASEGTFPEQQDWYRNTQGGGAQRSFEDGAFLLDSSADPPIVDMYSRTMQSLPDPNDPTHAFVCEWRLRVSSVNGWLNPNVAFQFMGYGDIVLGYDMGRIYSYHESKYIGDFEPGVLHTYRLVTSDMVAYTLTIDDVDVYAGDVSPWAPVSAVTFGDNTPSSGGESRWSYVRYGVVAVPEPGPVLLCVTAVLGLRSRLRRRTR
jgi:hypothetical protein